MTVANNFYSSIEEILISSLSNYLNHLLKVEIVLLFVCYSSSRDTIEKHRNNESVIGDSGWASELFESFVSSFLINLLFLELVQLPDDGELLSQETIPESLEEILNEISTSGIVCHDWRYLRRLIKWKLCIVSSTLPS